MKKSLMTKILIKLGYKKVIFKPGINIVEFPDKYDEARRRFLQYIADTHSEDEVRFTGRCDYHINKATNGDDIEDLATREGWKNVVVIDAISQSIDNVYGCTYCATSDFYKNHNCTDINTSILLADGSWAVENGVVVIFLIDDIANLDNIEYAYETTRSILFNLSGSFTKYRIQPTKDCMEISSKDIKLNQIASIYSK
jgi:hypothetical protein